MRVFPRCTTASSASLSSTVFLLWDFMKKSGGEGLMRALLRFFYLNHYKVIIEGVETPEHKKWLDEMPYYALQGKLWKESSIKDLNSLLTAEYF